MTLVPFDAPPFALTAITLRGIGSYRSGQRLEIKPMTIICGPNGSGKSTWLKALKIIRDSLNQELIPFQFAQTAEELTNAFYHTFEATDDGKYASDPDIDHHFGPPGTIGLEFMATRNILRCKRSRQTQKSCLSRNMSFVYDSDCFSAGTRFSLRMAHPSFHDTKKSPNHLVDFVELRINDAPRVRFVGKLDPYQKGEFRSLPTVLYLAANSGAFKGIANDTDLTLKLAVEFKNGFDLPIPSEDCVFPNKPERDIGFGQTFYAKDFVREFANEIQGMLTSLLEGCFWIGALRDIEKSSEFIDYYRREANDPDPRMRRYVGSRGEYSWRVFYDFENCLCRTREISGLKLGNLAYWFGDGHHEDGGVTINSPMKDHILSFASDQFKQDLADPDPFTFENCDRIADELISFLKAQLLNRELFDSRIFGELAKKDPEVRFWTSKDREFLSVDELVRLNSILIEEASAETPTDIMVGPTWQPPTMEAPRKLPSGKTIQSSWHREFDDANYDRESSTFQNQISEVLSYLTGQKIQRANFDGDEANRQVLLNMGYWKKAEHLPISMRLVERQRRPVDEVESQYGVPTSNSLRKVLDPCFAPLKGQFPSKMSAGFHQVFPIIVQTVAARPYEVVAIENPEVHCHPGLVRRLTEYLIDTANSGRFLLIETHSDLLVRRVVRSFLNEELSQSAASIYFIDLVSGPPIQFMSDENWKVNLALEPEEEFPDRPADSSLSPEKWKQKLPEIRKEWDECWKKADSTSFHEAKLQKIEFDEHRRIKNWPNGFLDDDADESALMLDALSDFPFEENRDEEQNDE